MSDFDSTDGCLVSKTKDENEASSQIATQPCDDLSDSLNSSYPELERSFEDPVWGTLYPLQDNWKAIQLINDKCTVGRSSSNTFPILGDQAGERLNAISKVHFSIRRAPDGTVLEDMSSNGTFVNGHKIGKGKSRLLEHNSTISLTHPKQRQYVYMSTSQDYSRNYPAELSKKYIVSRDLGSGVCGVVRLGFERDGNQEKPRRVAIKSMDKKKLPLNKGAASDVMNEVKILRSIDHPCVIQLLDVIDTENVLYIILELADGGELFDKILEKIKFSEKEAKIHFYQMLSAVQYLHQHNIAHRDLKPENILLSNDDTNPLIKISDMGLSKLVDHTTFLQTFCGTPQYLAPEVLISRVRGDGSYGFEVDMWALGVILYILLSGCPPFSPERTDKSLIRQVCDGDYSFPKSKWASVDESAIDLVEKLMTVDISKRLTAEKALNHPWLSDQENTERAKRLMDAERKKRNPIKNGHIKLPKPDSLIHESDSTINLKKRSIELSSGNDVVKSQHLNGFTYCENNDSDGTVAPPSKKLKA